MLFFSQASDAILRTWLNACLCQACCAAFSVDALARSKDHCKVGGGTGMEREICQQRLSVVLLNCCCQFSLCEPRLPPERTVANATSEAPVR